MAAVKMECRLLEHGADLPLPCYASAFAAGADLRAALQVAPYCGHLTIAAGTYAKVPTALQIALPTGYEAQVRPRSGLAAKNGLTVLNSPGTIDADYRGEIAVLLVNLGQQDVLIQHGDRIAQLVIAPVAQAEFLPVDQLSQTARAAGGFGSSGLQ